VTRERAFLALAAVVIALSVVFDFPFCPFAALAGIPCPGCGLGRATLALLRGDLHAALHLHPLVLVAVPAMVVAAATHFGHVTVNRRASTLLTASAGVLVVALFIVWGVRFTGGLGGPVPVLSPWAALGPSR
jgi:hypothetical protein